MRVAPGKQEVVLVGLNLTPVVRDGYRLGVPESGIYRELLNSDAEKFGGSNVINEGDFVAEEVPWHDQPYSIVITLPPLGSTFLKKLCSRVIG